MKIRRRVDVLTSNGGVTIRKSAIGIVIVFVILGWFGYQSSYHRGVNAFTIDFAKETTEKYAASLIDTNQKYNFRLTNISDRPVKILNIEMQEFKGIKIGDLTIDGTPFSMQQVPSHRVYTSTDSWATTNQGIMVEYDVKILESVIQNPRSALITYSYRGLTHQQAIKIPMLR